MQDNTRFDGRVAIVTGAGSRDPGTGTTTIGNGRAIATLLARRGARVLLLDIAPEWLKGTEEMIRAEGGTCASAVCDVSKAEDCAKAVADAVRLWGRLDILVNNVGISGPPGDATVVDPEAWDHGMQVNVKSMMLMAKYAVPEMRRQGGGAIVNLASVAGLQGGHPGLLYATAKGAIVQMTRAMAVHHAADRIRVNCVCPGMVYTPMVQQGGMTPERREARRNRSVLRVEGSGWDVGAAVAFLCGGNSRWMTGAIVPVDAGATAIAMLPGAYGG